MNSCVSTLHCFLLINTLYWQFWIIATHSIDHLVQSRANDSYDGVEEGYESSRDEISSISSYNPTKENLIRTFGSSLSLQSSIARSSFKDVSYLEGEQTSISSYAAPPCLSVAEVLYDSTTGEHKSLGFLDIISSPSLFDFRSCNWTKSYVSVDFLLFDFVIHVAKSLELSNIWVIFKTDVLSPSKSSTIASPSPQKLSNPLSRDDNAGGPPSPRAGVIEPAACKFIYLFIFFAFPFISIGASYSTWIFF